MRFGGRWAAAPEVPVGPLPEESRPERRRTWLHVLLFAITLVTTTTAGALNAGVPLDRLPSEWTAGLPFALTLMGILFVHEMGHFLTARWHGVDATLPYFIPGPPVLIGTFGAFIRMKSPPATRRALFDVGAAGPWAGLVVALPLTVYGLSLSGLEAIPPDFAGLYFGDSLLFRVLSRWIVGPVPPGFDVVLHPIALAGWFGLFVTALNLLPIGQLDGGHVIYAMFGRRHRLVGRIMLVGIVALGFLGWAGWFVWAVLVMFIGVDHPPTVDRHEALDGPRWWMGWATIAVFVVTLVPTPITLMEGGDGPSREELQMVERTEGARHG